MMRRIALTLAILAFAFQPALAGFLINSYSVVPGIASISFVGCTESSTDQTTYTFTDHATGTAGNRWTIVGVASFEGTTDFSTASMTVGGNAASEVVDSADTGALTQAALYIISNPSGTTATIVVTASEAIAAMNICVWAAYDILSATAHDTGTDFETASAALDLSLNVPTDGIGVAMTASNAFSSPATTWTGMTERVDDPGPEASASYSGADTTTVGTPLSVTSDWNGSLDSTGVSASFR